MTPDKPQSRDICPLMSRPVFVDYGNPDDRGVGVEFVPCQRERCHFWTQVYTIEGHSYSECSFQLMPGMNSDGHLAV